jgi:hypothetical protein
VLQKNQMVYFKKMPSLLYGTIVNVIDEGPGKDPSVVVQPDKVRCHASSLESAEIPESSTDKLSRVLSGPRRQIWEQWATNPESKDLQAKMIELLREIDLIVPINKK